MYHSGSYQRSTSYYRAQLAAGCYIPTVTRFFKKVPEQLTTIKTLVQVLRLCVTYSWIGCPMQTHKHITLPTNQEGYTTYPRPLPKTSRWGSFIIDVGTQARFSPFGKLILKKIDKTSPKNVGPCSIGCAPSKTLAMRSQVLLRRKFFGKLII